MRHCKISNFCKYFNILFFKNVQIMAYSTNKVRHGADITKYGRGK